MLKENEELVVVPDAAAAARAGAERFLEVVNGSSQRVNIALAGGRTPAAMYQLLTQSPYREQVKWETIDWFWGDERCVPPDHADSNYRMAMETLLGPLRISEQWIHRMPADAKDLDAAAREHEKTIRATVKPGVDGVPQFDLILLGIGADGHTASLFPGSEGLKERDRLVIAHYAPAPKAMRMTMTYPVLWAARQMIFLVCGDDKAEAIERIFNQQPDQAPPAAKVREGQARITWVLDSAAARLVSPSSKP